MFCRSVVLYPQIRAELMMLGTPVKDVRLMRRKDTGESPLSERVALQLIFHHSGGIRTKGVEITSSGIVKRNCAVNFLGELSARSL